MFSPLASRLGNIYGEWVGWRYLAFRYLGLFLLFLSVYATGIYSLLNTKYKTRIVIGSVVALYLFFAFRGNLYWFCWDNWSTCGLTFAILVTLALNRKFSVINLVLLAVLSGITTLFRLPSISMVPVSLLLLFLICRSNRFSFSKTVSILLVYVGFFILTVFVIITLLYGSFPAYVTAFDENPVMQHSLSQITLPFFGYLILCLAIAFLNLIFEKGIGRIRKRYHGWLKNIFLSLIFLCVLVMIFPRQYGIDRLATVILGIIDYALFVLFVYGKKTGNRKLMVAAVTIFFLSAVESIGSNMGYFKSLTWPAIPLIAMLLGNKFTRNQRILCCFWGVAFVIVSLIVQIRYWNENSYEIKGNNVLSGMRANSEWGEKIDAVLENVGPYIQDGYAPIVVREGNKYIWEYLFMAPNRHQRHLFNNWWAFDDEQYVAAIQEDMENSQKPPIILYMQWENPEEDNRMVSMLKRNAVCVVNEPGFSFWMKKE